MKLPRKKRYYLLFVLWLTVVGVGLRIGVDLTFLHRDMTAYRAEGYPLSPEELAEWTRLSDYTPNAVPLIEAAMATLDTEIVETHDVPFLGEVDCDLAIEPLSPDLMDNIRIVLEANKETLSLLHEAAKYEHYNANKQYDWVNTGPTDDLSKIRDFVRLLRLEALYRGEVGVIDRALDSISVEYAMARFAWQEPLLISWFVAKALDGMADASLKTLIQRESLSDAQLQRATKLAKSTANSGKMDRMLIGERANMFDEAFNNHNTIKERWEHIDFLLVESSFPEMAGQVWNNARELTRGFQEERNYLRFMQTIIEIGSLPPLDALEAYGALPGISDEDAEDNFIPNMMGPMYHGLFQLQCEKILTTDMLVLGIEIERFRLHTDQLPDTLADLVPEYLDTVPLSPFDGEPLHYEQINNGFWVGYQGTTRFDTHVYDAAGNDKDNTGRPYVRIFH
ncbi:MAG: hypothetical protein COA73_15405 [Candidatus Hydrogenedentota bacterium]|nr:MAG: hypothetical protein COA73_15405 [Candidatus Hydrogenedentota bacterium]